MIQELADIIHAKQCHYPTTDWTCQHFKHGNEHFEHFMSMAGELMDKLEPEIGSGNVIPTCASCLT